MERLSNFPKIAQLIDGRLGCRHLNRCYAVCRELRLIDMDPEGLRDATQRAEEGTPPPAPCCSLRPEQSEAEGLG